VDEAEPTWNWQTPTTIPSQAGERRQEPDQVEFAFPVEHVTDLSLSIREPDRL